MYFWNEMANQTFDYKDIKIMNIPTNTGFMFFAHIEMSQEYYKFLFFFHNKYICKNGPLSKKTKTKIILIYKNSDESDPSNYRQIFLLFSNSWKSNVSSS